MLHLISKKRKNGISGNNNNDINREKDFIPDFEKKEKCNKW